MAVLPTGDNPGLLAPLLKVALPEKHYSNAHSVALVIAQSFQDSAEMENCLIQKAPAKLQEEPRVIVRSLLVCSEREHKR